MFKGLGNLANLGSLLKQAQPWAASCSSSTRSSRSRRAEGTAGGGMVTVEVNGLGEVLRCQIDPALFARGDRELVEDLLPAAVNQALAKSKQLARRGHEVDGRRCRRARLDAMLAQLSGGDPNQSGPKIARDGDEAARSPLWGAALGELSQSVSHTWLKRSSQSRYIRAC